jgi:hypothetical protein
MSARSARRMLLLLSRAYSRRNALAFSSWLSASRCTWRSW